MANGRRNRKFIKSLVSEDGVVLNNIESISKEIKQHFEKLLSKPLGSSWRIEGLDWSPISAESVEWFDRPFSKEEIHNDVLHLNKEKAPSPDGFTIAKVLSGRLHKVLQDTLFSTQGAFVEGRQILDVVLTTNELVDEKKRLKEEEIDCEGGKEVFFGGFWWGRDRIKVSHLQFADDTIFSLEHSWKRCSLLRGNSNSISFWDLVVDRVSRRLDAWK
ncbi:hypothetical protein CK203_008473 [Vitis vinifera]|uniref:Reverse transcriptase domain-containing protein n=1 Tax=Vitis vinifera TaxID=29760 RepID=A0A438KNA9_VITVI|nr:hypothetical protein CK203_008473 [Vitis vinifera]